MRRANGGPRNVPTEAYVSTLGVGAAVTWSFVLGAFVAWLRGHDLRCELVVGMSARLVPMGRSVRLGGIDSRVRSSRIAFEPPQPD